VEGAAAPGVSAAAPPRRPPAVAQTGMQAEGKWEGDVIAAAHAQSGGRARGRAGALHLLDRTIFVGLLALIVLTAIPYGSAEPWWEAVFECAVFALTALWIVEGLWRGSWRTARCPLLWPLLALSILAYSQALPVWGGPLGLTGASGAARQALSADPYETLLSATKLLSLTLALGLLLRYTEGPSRLRALVHVVSAVGVASAVFGLVWRVAGQGVAGAALPALVPEASFGQFFNRNHFAFLMEMTLGLMLGVIAGAGRRRQMRLAYLALSLPVWTALVLANSRGGIISMFGQLLFFTLVLPRARGRDGVGGPGWWRPRRAVLVQVVASGLLLIAVTAGVVFVGGDAVLDRLETVPTEFDRDRPDLRAKIRRLEIWDATWGLVKDHWWGGVGFGAYGAAIHQYYDSSGRWTPQQAHNDYLELLASGGLIGASLGAWFLALIIKCGRGRLRSEDPFRRAVCCGAFTGIFGIAIHSSVEFGLHVMVNALVFIGLVVIATVPGEEVGNSSLVPG